MVTQVQQIPGFTIFSTAIIIIIILSSFPPPSSSSGLCNKSCGGVPHPKIPFPFGFSPECEIQLNCTSNGTMLIHDFPVQEIDEEAVWVNLPAQCWRPMEAIRALFGPNYAPTSRNGILMENCSSPLTSCVIPTTMVQTHFELLHCGSKNSTNMSCYSEPNNQSLFMNYSGLAKAKCDSLFSAISVESFGSNLTSVSLRVQLVQLGWWVRGHCQCSDHASCTGLTSPEDGRAGYRCQCLEGYVGDGYAAGNGCREDSFHCNPGKYLSGQCGGKTRIGALVGGIVAGAALMVSFGLICCCLRRRSRSKIKNRTRRELCKATGSINIPVYDYKDVEKATDSFSEKRRLGTGAYGAVYSGKLHGEEWVAIKRIWHRNSSDSVDQVINEIRLISSVSHPNLVRLLGCSIEKGEQILVYEFMPNGTLCQHLQRERSNGNVNGNGGMILPWPVRVQIATETAQAISYLHNAVHPPIYHRDIKSSNILLDYDYKAKVADFGLSRLGLVGDSHVSTTPQGTPGYLDPQYHQHFHLSDKSDVYSFGVVLLEIITGLKAVDFNRPQHEINLANLAVDRIGKGCVEEIIDPVLELGSDPWTLSSIHKVAELAFRCLAFHRDMRPSMMEVAVELEQIKLSKWAISEDSLFSGFRASTEISSCSSSSSICERPLHVVNSSELVSRGLGSNRSLRDQHPWPSEQSSPSSNSLLGHV